MRYDPNKATSKLVELGPEDLSHPIAAVDRFILEAWMQHRYGMPMSLGSTMCLVYSRIYESSRSNIGFYCESQGALARSIDRSRRQVVECLRRLVELGLIAEVGYVGNPKTGIKAYRVCPGPINECVRAHALDLARRIEGEDIEKAPDLSKLVLYERPVTGSQTERTPASDEASASAAKAAAAAAEAAVRAASAAVAVRVPSPDGPASANDTAPAKDVPGEETASEPERPADETRSAELSEADERTFGEIVSEWPKKMNRQYLGLSRDEFRRLIDQRHTAADVANACFAYLDDFFDPTRPSSQRNPRFVKHLNRFLSEPDGVRAWLRCVGDSGPEAPDPSAACEGQPIPCDDSGLPARSFSRITSMGSSSWLATVTFTGECFEIELPPEASREDLDRAFEREARRRGIVR